MVAKEFVTWQQFGDLVTQLISKLPRNRFKYVFGQPRGGLPIVTMISHYLEVPLTLHPYPSEWEPPLCFEMQPKDILITDDIVDRGLTCLPFHNLNYPIAVLHYKPKTATFEPDYYVEETDKWIVYPWEKEDEIPNR